MEDVYHVSIELSHDVCVVPSIGHKIKWFRMIVTLDLVRLGYSVIGFMTKLDRDRPLEVKNLLTTLSRKPIHHLKYPSVHWKSCWGTWIAFINCVYVLHRHLKRAHTRYNLYCLNKYKNSYFVCELTSITYELLIKCSFYI